MFPTVPSAFGLSLGCLLYTSVKVKDGTDVTAIMRDMMSVILEGALDEEMDEELGYSKYDYRNKETDNSRNGYSRKTCLLYTSTGLYGVRKTDPKLVSVTQKPLELRSILRC